MSVIHVVFFLPILPQAIDTMGSSLISPQFLASICLKPFLALLTRHLQNIHTANATSSNGAFVRITCKSTANLQTYIYKCTTSNDTAKYK